MPHADRPSTDTVKSRYEVSLDCVHCGLCLQVCPTYTLLGQEADSPRGRIYLMRAHDEHRQELTADFAIHINRCLSCRACETACPSGVQFGQMIEEFRSLINDANQSDHPSLKKKLVRWLLRSLIPNKRRLHHVVNLMWLAQVSGTMHLLRKLGVLRVLNLEQQEQLLPRLKSPRGRKEWPERLAPFGEQRGRVLFLRGCVAPEFVSDLYVASLHVLQVNGCEVVTPPTQTCCGALHFHSGFHREGLELLGANLNAFDVTEFDAVIVNAAGCGSTLKEYDRLAPSGLESKAESFKAKVCDISEFLDNLGLRSLGENPAPAVRVAYDEPCHLIHGQGISAAPKRLLRAIPGVQLIPLVDADRCCGSAGSFNLTQPDLAQSILDEKIRNILLAKVDVVATGNPGCVLQIQAGLASRNITTVEVLHPVELLSRAYRAQSTGQ